MWVKSWKSAGRQASVRFQHMSWGKWGTNRDAVCSLQGPFVTLHACQKKYPKIATENNDFKLTDPLPLPPALTTTTALFLVHRQLDNSTLSVCACSRCQHRLFWGGSKPVSFGGRVPNAPRLTIKQITLRSRTTQRASRSRQDGDCAGGFP